MLCVQAAAKKSALADYWHSIKSSLNTEKTRLGHFGAAEALDRANRQMYDDDVSQSNSKLRSRRSRLLHNKLKEMQQEKVSPHANIILQAELSHFQYYPR